MAIEAVFAKAADDIFGILGEPVSYIDSLGASSQVTAIVKHAGQSSAPEAIQASAEIDVRESEVPHPEYQESFEIAGEIWTIVKRMGRSAGVWKLEIRKDLRPTFRNR